MILASVNPPQQLLYLNFMGNVRGEEVAAARENVIQLLSELKPGFRLISDLSSLESFDSECPIEIGKNMELFSERGIGLVVRVMPDSTKDIGFNILSFFHYTNPPRTVTCDTIKEAMRALAL